MPGADLRAPRALPVLVIDGRDDTDLAAAIAALVDDLADAEISVRQQAPADMEPFEARTIALFNRGMPSFAVDSEGTLHTALMRSCTGWPSRVWIDEPAAPRPTAPTSSCNTGPTISTTPWSAPTAIGGAPTSRPAALSSPNHCWP
ncbi:ALPHA-MANNOSIDASE domain protein [Mycobacterium ulcerans str. Harvey]|uniref:ALPHA-MANNOSIDASE domain protein n=1 Tax=Mycobacterium ulcerans str. Harvey TaxID=1299332 RepID=A0ABN0R5U8_MYCUL|nr:ALPHA-MANNOSIDASE domain protein [Mycobacterium ulcerans str. Harvey]